MLLIVCAGQLAAGKKAVTPKGFQSNMPFSAGVRWGDTLYVSGMTAHDWQTRALPSSFEEEVQGAIDNVSRILKSDGMSLQDVVSVQVYLTDIDLFSRMNAVYIKNFPEPRPSRTTVGVARLVGNAHIEITATARK